LIFPVILVWLLVAFAVSCLLGRVLNLGYITCFCCLIYIGWIKFSFVGAYGS
ncbi:hypothetical protein ACJX0J_016672, partial [Zea mays]